MSDRDRSQHPRVLIVEDEALIALMLEDLLEEMGCRIAGVAGSLTDAQDLAGTAQFDVALLDVNLGGEPIAPVIGVLQARGIPFLLVTGYDPSDLPAGYGAYPMLRKPLRPSQLPAALRDCMERVPG